ncbi:MAG: thrombospondin type 3 repeat-containing protein [bacterium]|nr:thrombospondin type 3 repeat-containing protein [bacterium]
MKKLTLISSTIFLTFATLLFISSTYTFALETPIQPTTNSFSKYQEITSDITIPTVIEMPLVYSQKPNDQYLIIEQDNNQFQPYEIINRDIPTGYSVYSDANKINEGNLDDNNPNTYVDYEINSDQTKTSVSWKLIYTEPISSNSFFYNLDINSRSPINITIEKVDENYNLITTLVKEQVASNTIKFPTTSSQYWKVNMTFSQPLRVNEMGFITTTKTTKNYLRFLARPGKEYLVYSEPTSYVNINMSEKGNLANASEVKSIQQPFIYSNNINKESDYDLDGIFNSVDNCIYLSNPTQDDINTNKIGDACEDFDNDTISNSIDNCPDQPNKNQIDTDGDGVGDHCDTEESRLTEKIKWLPWLGLIIGFTVVFGLLITTVKTNKPETPEVI